MRAVLGLMLLALGACSATRPASGSMEDGSETFSGTSMVNGDRTGTLIVQSDKGLLCTGDGATSATTSGAGSLTATMARAGRSSSTV
jgi:hypothetical protein